MEQAVLYDIRHTTTGRQIKEALEDSLNLNRYKEIPIGKDHQTNPLDKADELAKKALQPKRKAGRPRKDQSKRGPVVAIADRVSKRLDIMDSLEHENYKILKNQPGCLRVMHMVAVMSADPQKDPKSFKQAMQLDKAGWTAAVNAELENMRSKEVWRVVKYNPTNARRVLRLFWVFKTKRDSSGVVTKKKGRLVVMGNWQTPEQYDQTYAGVVQKSGICMFFNAVHTYGFATHKMDVTAAFLNGKLEDEIYCFPPDGVKVPPGHLLKLEKALYGLKQAPRLWFETFNAYIKSRNFVPVPEDPAVFTLHEHGKLVSILTLYVDDILLGGTPEVVARESKALGERFEISDEGPVDEYLGIKVDMAKGGTCLSLPGNIENMVQELRRLPQIAKVLPQAKYRGVPMATGWSERIAADFKIKDRPPAPLEDVRAMQKVAGCLNYLVTCGRIDLSVVACHQAA